MQEILSTQIASNIEAVTKEDDEDFIKDYLDHEDHS
jgi:hypothetical protein